MSPVIAIIGRANVGKSTLFNILSHTKDALVYDAPGVTCDRKYAIANYNDYSYIVIDTGGISENICDTVKINNNTSQSQSFLAMEEANLVYFIVDAKSGLTSEDYYIAKILRSKKIRILYWSLIKLMT
jgi:GTP-binding protein